MRRVLPLTLGFLALGLDAYVIAGVLPAVGHDLRVSPSAAGQLVTAFTLSYALLSPVLATLLAGRRIQIVLLAALGVFTLGNLLSAVAGSYALLLAARVVAGAGAGVYSPMAASAAASLVPASRRGQALGLLTGAMSTGAAAGVPLGLLLAYHAGWRSVFWLLTALGVLAIAMTAATVPAEARVAVPPLRARAAVLTDRRVAAVAAVMLLASATSIGMYTYLAPLLAAARHVTRLDGYLWIWGAGGLLGSLLAGRLTDTWRDTRALVSVILAILGVTLAVFPFASAAVPLLLLVWGAAGWGSLAPQQHRMLVLGGDDGPVAVSLNASALYLGSAVGASVGGALLAGGTGVRTLSALFGAIALAAAGVNLRTPSAA